MLDQTVSIYRTPQDKVGKEANLLNILNAIADGKWKGLVDQHRSGQEVKFPGFVSTGTFSIRNLAGNTAYTGIITLDFDKLDNAREVLEQVSNDKFVAYAFRSRGGKGLAVGIYHEYGAAAHKMVAIDAMGYFYSKYGIEPDTPCKDISRLRFVSHDPDLFYDLEATPYTLQVDNSPEDDRPSGYGQPYTARENLVWAAKTLESQGHFFIEGNRHNFRFKLACFVNRLGVPKYELESFMRERYPSDNPTNAIPWVYKSFIHEHGSRSIRRRVATPSSYTNEYVNSNRSSSTEDANTVSGPAIYMLQDEMDLYKGFRDNGVPAIPGLGFSKKFDEHMRIIPGMMSTVIASANTGKTTFMLNKMVYMAVRFGWKFALFTPEQDAPKEIMGQKIPLKAFVVEVLASVLIGKPISKVKEFRRNGIGTPEMIMPMSESEYNAALNFINEHFIFMNPQAGDAAFASIMGLAEYAVQKHDVKGIVVDPWNMVEDSLGDYTEAADKFRAITQFKRRTNVGWWITNHVSKTGLGSRMEKGEDGLTRKVESMPSGYDGKGGTEWMDMSDYVTVLFRPKGEPETTIRVEKIRFQPVCGKIGEFRMILNLSNNRFYEIGRPSFDPLINIQEWA